MKRNELKSVKRQEAEERNAKWVKLSTEQKIEHLNKNKLRAKKQRAKLGCFEIPEDCIF